jgi:hypothetical protein
MGPEMANPVFAKRVYSLQNLIVRELNNAHIFLEQAQPLLAGAKAKYEKSKSKTDRRYYVPFVGRTKFAKRTDAELKAIYSQYISTGLFEAFLIRSLSQFESFLGNVLIEFLAQYPLRVTERVQGIPACPDVPVQQLIGASDKDCLLRWVLNEHIMNVFRQRPSTYMAYVVRLLGIKHDPSFLYYYEIAATRDLIVHSGCVINSLYLDKAGRKARGKLGLRVVVDRAYYYEATAHMKKVAGAIKRNVENKYG